MEAGLYSYPSAKRFKGFCSADISGALLSNISQIFISSSLQCFFTASVIREEFDVPVYQCLVCW